MASGDPVVQIFERMPPATLAATIGYRTGGSTPNEELMFYNFVNGSVTHRDYYCRLVGYDGGGLTLHGAVIAPTVTSGTFIIGAAIRRLADDAEDIDSSHSYQYNDVTITVASISGEPKYFTITFTDGADMDDLADGEWFILRIRRNGGSAAEAAQLLSGISGLET